MFYYLRASYNQLPDKSEIDIPDTLADTHIRLIIPPSVRKAFMVQADDPDLLGFELLDRQCERMKREPSYKDHVFRLPA